MMSPEEVRTVTFDKQNMGGYRRSDVDSFLQQIADEMAATATEMEKAQQEKAEADQKLLVLAQKIEEYRKDEDNVKTALLNAQRMAENIIREAKQKSEAMLREAGIKADDIVQDARRQLTEQEAELERAQTEVARFKESVLQMYEQHLNLLAKLPGKETRSEPAPVEEIAVPEEAVAQPEAVPESELEPEVKIAQPVEVAEPAEEESAAEITFDLSGQAEPEEEKKEEPEAPAKSESLFDSFQGIRFSD